MNKRARVSSQAKKCLLQRDTATEGHKRDAAESPPSTCSLKGAKCSAEPPQSPCGPLTGQRLHVQLRLLRIHVILHQRVDVRKDEPHRAHRGAQLPQRVGSRLLGLGAKPSIRTAVLFLQ